MDLDLELSIRPPKIQKLQGELTEGSHEKQDVISRLPRELLIHILSLLPEGNAPVTSLLSTKWKELWAFLPDLRLVMPYCFTKSEVHRFLDFAERILTLRNGMPIRKFSLFLSSSCDYARAYEILCSIIKCEVQECDLEFPWERVVVEFPWHHFIDCKSLVSLTLKGRFILDVPANVLFPSLKVLKLLSIIYSGDASVVNLFSACCVLENLYVERQLMFMETDNVQIFDISVLSLKVLKISFCQSIEGESKFVLDTPNLEVFLVVDLKSSEYAFKSHFSIIYADLEISYPWCVPGVLQSVSAAKNLYLGSNTLRYLSVGLNNNIRDTLVFNNLVKLLLAHNGWPFLEFLLRRMPNLEHLIFTEGLIPPTRLRCHSCKLRLYPPADVPACLQTTLTTIEIRNTEALIREELTLIRYFLRFGIVLKTMMINRHNIDPSVQRSLLRCRKGSESCQINLL